MTLAELSVYLEGYDRALREYTKFHLHDFSGLLFWAPFAKLTSRTWFATVAIVGRKLKDGRLLFNAVSLDSLMDKRTVQDRLNKACRDYQDWKEGDPFNDAA
jgi:hypothetical protein